VVRTATPTPYLIDMTPQRAFRPSPREAVSRSPKKWFRPENNVTSGEFHLEFWRQRDKFELVKSQTFWGKGDVKLDRVTILSMNDQSANANLYYQGGCDALVSNNVPSSYFPVLNGETGRGRPREDYIRSKFLGIYFYLVNVQKYPNPHFRRALSHALDRSLLPLLLKGGQIPTEQFMPGTPIAELTDDELALCNQFMDALRARTGRADLPPLTRESPGVATIVVKGEICYVPPMGPRYDLALAKRELELARQELGDKLPRRLTVKFNTGVEAHKSIAEWIQNQWEHNLGLNVSLESQEWKTFLKATRNQEYDVARMGSIGNFPDPEGEFLSQFKCASPDNRTAWCEPEFERLFKEAEATADRLQRMVLTWQAEDLVAQAAPTLPLYVYTQHNLQKPYVRGLAINFVDQQSLRDVWIDPDWKTSGKPKETPAP
jgi:ABC-type oligopeptide transport system substrate-binding subunit